MQRASRTSRADRLLLDQVQRADPALPGRHRPHLGRRDAGGGQRLGDAPGQPGGRVRVAAGRAVLADLDREDLGPRAAAGRAHGRGVLDHEDAGALAHRDPVLLAPEACSATQAACGLNSSTLPTSSASA